MDQRNRDRKLFRLGRDIVNAHDERQQCDDRQVDDCHDAVGPLDDLLHVGARLIELARADALAHHRGKAQVDGLTGKAVEVCDGVADGVRHHRRRAERRDQAEEHEASQLEHAVFDAARHTDVEDVLHQAHVQTECAHIGEVQRQLVIEEHAEDHRLAALAREEVGEGLAEQAAELQHPGGVAGLEVGAHQG